MIIPHEYLDPYSSSDWFFENARNIDFFIFTQATDSFNKPIPVGDRFSKIFVLVTFIGSGQRSFSVSYNGQEYLGNVTDSAGLVFTFDAASNSNLSISCSGQILITIFGVY